MQSIDYISLLKELFDNMPYWVFALGVACGFYGVTGWFGEKHVSNEAKETLSLWLWGEYKTTWTAQYCILFDAIFSNKHLSIRCFRRSVLLSLLSVLLLTLLFNNKFLHIHQEETRYPVFLMIFLGLLVNTVPDYISLYETRWILHRFHEATSILRQSLLLILDIIITGVIIWISINLFYFTTHSHTFPNVSVVQLLMVYEETSIFFYSTFITSFWAWLYCLSSWIMRLFSSSPFNTLLNIENKPVEQLALVCSILLFLLMLMFESLFVLDNSRKPALLDEISCYLSSSTCKLIASFSKDEETAKQYISKGCSQNDALSCSLLGDMYEDKKDYINAKKHYQEGCLKGDYLGCLAMGYLYRDGLGVKKDLKKSFEIFNDYCNKNYADACYLLANYYFESKFKNQDYKNAVHYYEKACPKNKRACVELGRMYQEGLGINADKYKALQLYRKACVNITHDYIGCVPLGYLYQAGLGVKKDRKKALELYRIACDSEYIRGCTLLGNLYNDNPASDTHYSKKMKWYFRGCEGGDGFGCMKFALQYKQNQTSDLDVNLIYTKSQEACNDNEGCANLGIMKEYGLGIEVNINEAIILYSKACKGKYSDGCVQLGVIAEQKGDSDEAIRLYHIACDEWHPLACTRLGLLYKNVDSVAANKGLARACNNGSVNACEYLVDFREKLCNEKISWACLELGYMYDYGVFVEVDTNAAHLLYQDGCSVGNSIACSNLGNNYKYGIGIINKNLQKAKEYYQLACDGGFAKSCIKLAILYEQRPRRYKQPIKARLAYKKACVGGYNLGCKRLGKYYKRSCNRGVAMDCNKLGWLYRKGDGFDQDYLKASTLFSKSCNIGYALGCTDLGVLYRDGKGVLQDYQKSLDLFHEACKSNDLLGCYFLGAMYLEGLGISHNYEEAKKLFIQTCGGSIGNLPYSCLKLGDMYFNGFGVPKDHQAANNYYMKACEYGYEDACYKNGKIVPAIKMSDLKKAGKL